MIDVIRNFQKNWRPLLIAGLLGFSCIAVVLFAPIFFPAPIVIPGSGINFQDPEAGAAYEEACAGITNNPDDPIAWGRLGILLAFHKQFGPAGDCLQRSEELDTNEWLWPYLRAVCNADADLVLAKTVMKEAIRRAPRAEWPRLKMAEWELRLGDPQAAYEMYASLLADFSGSAIASLGASRALLSLQNLDDAYDILTAALAHPATRRAAYETLAQIESARGHAKIASEALQEARSLPMDVAWPGDPWNDAVADVQIGKQALYDQILSAEESGNTDEGRNLFRKLLLFHPELALLFTGREKLKDGDALAAETLFRKGLTIDPNSLDLKEELGNALLAQGKSDEAAQLFRSILSVEPSYVRIWSRLATALKDSDPAASRAATDQVKWYDRPSLRKE
jgi:predicted Zn-dependent protease